MNCSIIKSELLLSGQFQRISRASQLIFVHALTAADDYARIDADAWRWKSSVCPGFDLAEVEAAFAETATVNLMLPYSVEATPYFFIPYFAKVTRFSYRYKVRAKYPNPETGEIEEPVLFGDLLKNGWADTSRAAADSRFWFERGCVEPAQVSTATHCQVVESCSPKSEKERIQLTTTSHCHRTAKVSDQPPILNVVETRAAAVEDQVLRLMQAQIPLAVIRRTLTGPGVEDAIAVILLARKELHGA